ncbi:DNA modification methylase [Promineifilum sp.]|uniref:DNA modification methylase n=1 Tax=Promineifilum sp. TaxID=2664178 RepID=UPI0035B2737A
MLKEIGLVQNVVANRTTGHLVDGHLRVMLAMRENQPVVPVTWVELSEEEERLILASLDPLAAMATADAGALDALLSSVQSGEAAVQAMLAELAEGAGLYAPKDDSDAEPQIDRAEELRQEWGVELGQLWRLPSRTAEHEHRLICGDCTEAAVVERVMGDDLVELVVTDPPYGVSYADKNRFLNAISPANRIEEPILNDHQSKEQTQALWRSAFERMSAVMCPGAVVYCFMPQGGDQMMMMMMMMMMGAGIEPRHELVWLKNNHVLGRVDYAYRHEPILYAWKDGGHKFYGDFQTSVLEFPKPQLSDMHPTTKPLALVERLISNSSRPRGAVYDCFLGSGTTIIACENLSRQCRAVELSPGYTAVALERYFQAFGIEAELVG